MSYKQTSQTLRSHYQAEGGVHQLFSSKVADYLASRPDYAPSLFDTLQSACALTANSVIADIGAGTGLLTHDLLRKGWQTTAIEPSKEMREAADSLLNAYPHYRSLDGCAESIPLADQSVDLITAAQAFHWFDIQRAKQECLRVLKPKGKVALIWNDRVLDDPLHIELDRIFAKFGGARRAALVAHESQRDTREFFGSNPEIFSFPHQHSMTESGLIKLVFSRSYMPALNTEEGENAAQAVCDLFKQLSINKVIDVRYQTVAYIARPKAY